MVKAENQLPEYHLVIDTFENHFGKHCLYNCYGQMLLNSGKKVRITAADAVAQGDEVLVYQETALKLLKRRFKLQAIKAIGNMGWVYYRVAAKPEQEVTATL